MRLHRAMLCLCLTMLQGLTFSNRVPARDSSDVLNLQLRSCEEASPGTGRFHRVTRDETWDPRQTAIIVCDMWDLHHSINAVRREQEFAPRLNEVLSTARERGIIIIHAPSGCMENYAGHPARERAHTIPLSANLPEQIAEWCRHIPAEERGVYPVDQTKTTEDDDPVEHAAWEKKLEGLGRDPKAPWKSQIEVITIDDERDYISDRGEEIWSILESRGIDNVILTGVHTNMCVLGRPFGLRQMARNGKHVVLMRDMTDTMYNPQEWPYVSHFTGTDLIIEHIEKFVCPTITSDQFVDGPEFRFKDDKRPRLVMLIGEDEYKTAETLPKFAAEHLGNDYRVSIVHADEQDKNRFPGIDVIQDADILLVSVRRRTPPPEQLDFVRRHVQGGKPVIGIRTASHAFTLRNQSPPEGLDAWPEFDAQVLGGNYTNHYGNEQTCKVFVVHEHGTHPILNDVSQAGFTAGGSLYKVSPLAKGTSPLLAGSVEGADPEPVAWTYTRADGGRSFYTSLGHIQDFENPAFVMILKNAIDWAATPTSAVSTRGS